jgi:hypothetical protein
MSTLMQVYCAIAVPAALIGLFVGVYLHTLPDTDVEPYGVDDYAAPAVAPREPDRRHYRLMVLGEGVQVTALDDVLPPAPARMDAGTPIFDSLAAARILRELGAKARMEMAR